MHGEHVEEEVGLQHAHAISLYGTRFRSLYGTPSSTTTKKNWTYIDITYRSTIQQMPADPDSFNEHFVGSGNLVTLSDSRPTARISPDMRSYFKRVTVTDVLKAFFSAHSNALGPDDIPLKHLKDCLPIIHRPLINIFDTSLQSGQFPTEWNIRIYCYSMKNLDRKYF